MSKKIGEDGLEYVDGSPVEEYKARIANTFDMENEDAVLLGEGDLITLTVLAEVGSPAFARDKKSGRLRRVNKLTATEVTVVMSGTEVPVTTIEGEDDLWTLAEQ